MKHRRYVGCVSLCTVYVVFDCILKTHIISALVEVERVNEWMVQYNLIRLKNFPVHQFIVTWDRGFISLFITDQATLIEIFK